MSAMTTTAALCNSGRPHCWIKIRGLITALDATHVYLRIPSSLLVQMMTDLSADPDANLLPSFAYATQYTVSL